MELNSIPRTRDDPHHTSEFCGPACILRINQMGRPGLLLFQRDSRDSKWRKCDAVICQVLNSGWVLS